ncbi:MAG: rod shape-determining protein MreC [Gammaproteobacteria bacterium]
MRAPFPRQSQMKPLFMGGPSLILRLLFFTMISLILMTVDHRQLHLKDLRAGLSLLVYPVQYVVNLPAVWKQLLDKGLSSHASLVKDNERMARQNLLLKVRLQKFAALEAENMRLRELLQSSRKLDERMLIAELLAVDMDPFRHQVTLNKGSVRGVVAGQPLLDASGVMGQIVHVGPFTSTALLITDPSHALPVQINRNGLRGLAIGTGSFNRLDMPYQSKNADVRVGDLLITSGLGGGFPADYPVAKIVAVERQPGQPFAKISAEPSARLEHSREVLLVWPTKTKPITVQPSIAEKPMAAKPLAGASPASPPRQSANPAIAPQTPPSAAASTTPTLPGNADDPIE